MIGLQELILILAILLIIIGPKKLPELAKGIGRAIREFKKVSADVMSSDLKDDDDETKMIVRIARNLDIDIEGKSPKQIVEEIERKTVKNKNEPNIHRDR